MTREKWRKMSPNEQRIKVAELCGVAVGNKYLLHVETDDDFSLLFKGKLITGYEIDLFLDGVDDLKGIMLQGPFGSPDQPEKRWEWDEAVDCILRNPNTPFCNTGGNRGVEWDIVERPLPDYLCDLNAMHEAEKVFIQGDGCVWGESWEKYCNHLAGTVFLADPVNCLMRATAAQRAEAFCLTLEPEDK
jgi:hypothetical protein